MVMGLSLHHVKIDTRTMGNTQCPGKNFLIWRSRVKAGVLKKLMLVGISLLPFAVTAQTQPSPPDGIVLTPKPVSEIPAQYRADAVKPRKPFTVRFTCPDSGRLVVVFNNAERTATVEAGNTTRYLKQVPSADGGRYANSDESYVFWVKGQRATIGGSEVCEAD